MTQQTMNSTEQVLQHVKSHLQEVVTEARQNLNKDTDPKAEALLETTAEVLLGLIKAYDDYAKGSEKAWQ